MTPLSELRTLLERPSLEVDAHARMWTLAEQAAAEDTTEYAASWIPLLESFAHHTDEGILRWFEFSDETLWEASEAPDADAAAQALEAGLSPLDHARRLFPRAHFGLSFPQQSVGEGMSEPPTELMALMAAREIRGIDVSGSAGAHVWMMDAECPQPALRYLSLDGCEVDEKEILRLVSCGFFGARSLRSLSIQFPWFAVDGFRALASASCLADLEVLRIDVHEQELDFEEMSRIFEASPTFSGELVVPLWDDPSRRGKYKALMGPGD